MAKTSSPYRIRKGIRAATVRKVEPPKDGGWWKNLRRDQRWCVAWRTEMMPASAFEYCTTKRDAEEFARTIRREVQP